MKILARTDFHGFVNALIRDSGMGVEGVKAKGLKYAFGPLESAEELRLDYDVTILPPKKYFLPQYETMMTFDLSNPFAVRQPDFPARRILVGVHPYDIAALRQMDSYFLDTEMSTAYMKRRKNTLIIGSDILSVPERAFFGCMGTGTVPSGFDLFLTDLGGKVAIEIGTEEGARLLRFATNLREATPVDVQKVKALRSSASSKAMRGLKVRPQGWHDLLEKNFESPIWGEQSARCLGCGTCTLVCPTCFCYDVQDDVNLDLRTGERRRTWDGCLLRQFTEVGSGEVFRDDIADRYRHRFHRKGQYLPDRLGFVACVGCGRCGMQCIADAADPVLLINKIFDASPHLVEETVMDPQTVRTDLREIASPEEVRPLHLPAPATVKRAVALTDREMLFEIALDSGSPLGHAPGQFVEVSLFGTGEAPISVASHPGAATFDLVVRRVGDVTIRMHALKAGDKVGIRGPFGRGFDVQALRGRNLLFIGGGLGLAPMRSLINHVFAHRADFGEVTILYGCREPREVLFRDEVAAWAKRTDLQHKKTVDRCPNDVAWDGEVGVITTLLPRVRFDPHATTAIVVGPPVMYRFVIQDLLKLGMPERNIIVSLERRMKCGVGTCGHCQIHGICVCKEGPVFNYADIKDLPEAFS
jgi:NAD(P)H-flavin reductase/ferredoxin